MKQPIKKRTSITIKNKSKKSTAQKVKPAKRAVHHPKYGTSKLEEDIARDFLDKLGVKYVYQFETDIGRWFDFKIINGPIIEIQGSYWHGDSRIYEEKDLNKIQKKNIQVDAYKQKWALSHGIPIYYIWEKDMKESPDKVMAFLKEILYIEEKKKDKNKRHINKIK
jgi:hypothetical protein